VQLLTCRGSWGRAVARFAHVFGPGGAVVVVQLLDQALLSLGSVIMLQWPVASSRPCQVGPQTLAQTASVWCKAAVEHLAVHWHSERTASMGATSSKSCRANTISNALYQHHRFSTRHTTKRPQYRAPMHHMQSTAKLVASRCDQMLNGPQHVPVRPPCTSTPISG
jgi:hypothetical protein